MIKNLNQAGDTIVEVLIAMAVVSLVLGGAYATANRSFLSIKLAQERSEALKLAEDQLEQLRVEQQTATTNNTVNNPNSLFNRATIFCMNGGMQTSHNPVVNMGSLPAFETEDYSTYLPVCKGGSGSNYNFAINRSSPATDYYIFTVNVRWGGIRAGQHQVTLSYKLNK